MVLHHRGRQRDTAQTGGTRRRPHQRLDAELDAREQKQEDLQTTYIISLDTPNESSK